MIFSSLLSENTQREEMKFDCINKGILFFVFALRLDAVFYDNDTLFLIAIILSLFGISTFLLERKSHYVYSYLKWQFLFYTICFMSYFWAYDKEIAKIHLVALLGRIIIQGYIWLFISKTLNIRYILSCFIFVTALTILHYILSHNFLSLLSFREVTTVSSTGWNANGIGMTSAISVYFILLLSREKIGLLLSRLSIIDILICSILLVAIIGTSSKKSILLMFILIPSYIIMTGDKKGKNILLSLCLLFLFYLLIMNVEFLYNTVGQRFETLIGGLFDNTVDLSTSDSLRMRLIQYGTEMIKGKPLLGYGIGNYKAFLNLQFYSHNNYIEMLTGVGFIGFTIYYSSYIYVLVISLKNINEKNKWISLSLILALITIESGLVTYLDFMSQLLINISLLMVHITKDLFETTKIIPVQKSNEIYKKSFWKKTIMSNNITHF